MVNAQVATSLMRNLRVTSVASCTFFQQKSRGERRVWKNFYRQTPFALLNKESIRAANPKNKNYHKEEMGGEYKWVI
jgi:hypothetical protein